MKTHVTVNPGTKVTIGKDNIGNVLVTYDIPEYEFNDGDFIKITTLKNKEYILIYKKEGELNANKIPCYLQYCLDIDSIIAITRQYFYEGFISISLASTSEKAKVLKALNIQRGLVWDEETNFPKKFKWSPSEGEFYYYISSVGKIESKKFDGFTTDLGLIDSGNYFKNEELANVALMEWEFLFSDVKHN